MAKTSILRTVWSERFLYNLDKALVYGNITNTLYEGDAENANTVTINAMGDVTVSDYTGSFGWDDISTTSQDLDLDQKKMFAFKIDDVDKAQTNLALVDAAMERATYTMADEIDQSISGLYTGITSGSTGLGTDATPIVATGSNAYDTLVKLSQTLDEQNVPNFGRFVVLPPWYTAELRKDSRFTLNYEVLTNGILPGVTVAGMQVYQSNNVSHTSSEKYKIIAGTSDAIAFAGQLRKLETTRLENNFSDGVKGLYVYGRKIIKPTGLALLTANKS